MSIPVSGDPKRGAPTTAPARSTDTTKHGNVQNLPISTSDNNLRKVEHDYEDDVGRTSTRCHPMSSYRWASIPPLRRHHEPDATNLPTLLFP